MRGSKQRPGIKPDNEAAAVVKQIAQHYLNGKSLFGICDTLESQAIPAPKGGKKWHAVIVRNILRNPLHAGLIKQENRYIRGAHYELRIYDEDYYFQILDTMSFRRKFGGQTLGCPSASLGLVAVCDECGDRLRIIRPNDPYRSYRCEGSRRKRLKCKSRPYVRGEYLEKRVTLEIGRVASDPALIAMAENEARAMLSAGPSDHLAEIARLKAEKRELEGKWRKLAKDHSNGIISLAMLSACDKEYSEKQELIDARLAELEKTTVHCVDLEAQMLRVMQALRDFPRLWRAMEPLEKRTVFSLLIEYLRIGRGEGCIRCKLKLKFMDEVVFDLPVHSVWSDARPDVKKPPISLRQLAYLSLAADGYSDKQIAVHWRVKIANVRTMRNRAIAKLGVSTLEEALQLARTRIEEWREFLPIDWRHGTPGEDILTLTDHELQVLRGIACGKTDKEMAKECSVPLSTISGRRNRVRQKLRVDSKEAIVAQACSNGLLGPSDPSPRMLLEACQKLVLPVFRERLEELRLTVPTTRQLETLQALVDGLTAEETAKKMGVGCQSIVYLRARLWRCFRADSLRAALERVQQLGILNWSDDHDKDVT